MRDTKIHEEMSLMFVFRYSHMLIFFTMRKKLLVLLHVYLIRGNRL